MQRHSIDLNADLGEGYGPWSLTDDAGLMSVISSANMACGFHAGDPNHMAQVCRLAQQHNVSLGAHPGFDDKLHFGRQRMNLSTAELERIIAYQIGAACGIAALASTQIRYVKVHGALSNMSAEDATMSQAIARAIKAVDPQLIWLAISGSEHIHAAKKLQLDYRREAFIDRAYLSNGQLAPRSMPGSVHTDIATMLQQVSWLLDGKIQTLDEQTLSIECDSLCLHGDGAHALETAVQVRAHIERLGIQIKHFA